MSNDIKIVLFRGGFAGDLITALYDYSCFLKLNANGKVDIEKNRIILQKSNNMSNEEKENYLNQYNIISCTDTHFALKNITKTLIVTCSNEIMINFFCNRFKKYHPYSFTNTTINDYIKDTFDWQNYWPKFFKNQIDISDIFDNKNFLSKLGCNINEKKQHLFHEWKNINQKNFLDTLI